MLCPPGQFFAQRVEITGVLDAQTAELVAETLVLRFQKGHAADVYGLAHVLAAGQGVEVCMDALQAEPRDPLVGARRPQGAAHLALADAGAPAREHGGVIIHACKAINPDPVRLFEMALDGFRDDTACFQQRQGCADQIRPSAGPGSDAGQVIHRDGETEERRVEQRRKLPDPGTSFGAVALMEVGAGRDDLRVPAELRLALIVHEALLRSWRWSAGWRRLAGADELRLYENDSYLSPGL